MRTVQSPRSFLISCFLGTWLLGFASGVWPQRVLAQVDVSTLASGFIPNPTVMAGVGGGDRRAAQVVNSRQTPTGLCLGYISAEPHEEITLENSFSNLEVSVESELDTTLIISGPGGVWCNDDSKGSHNPAIVGEWLPGLYRIWVGSYQFEQTPDYQLYISDQS